MRAEDGAQPVTMKEFSAHFSRYGKIAPAPRAGRRSLIARRVGHRLWSRIRRPPFKATNRNDKGWPAEYFAFRIENENKIKIIRTPTVAGKATFVFTISASPVGLQHDARIQSATEAERGDDMNGIRHICYLRIEM